MNAAKRNVVKGISWPARIISGLIASFFLLITLLFMKQVTMWGKPSIKNAEQLVKKGNYAKALTVLETLNTKHKNSPQLLVEKGKVWFVIAWAQQNRLRWKDYGKDSKEWFQSKELDSAEYYFKRALAVDPACGEAHYQLGMLYMDKGWFSLAETHFLSVLKENKNHSKARSNLGVVYTYLKRFDMALQELLLGYAADPHDPVVVKNLTFLYRFYREKPDSALIWANRYLNLRAYDDSDFAAIRKEFNELRQRYPEYTLPEPIRWKKPSVFKSRFGK